MSNFVEQALAEQMEEVKRLKQLNQECGRSLKGLLEWSQKADMALDACVAALEEVWMLEDMGWTIEPESESGFEECKRCGAYKSGSQIMIHSPSCLQDKLNQAITLARPLLKTRPERN